MGLDTGTMWQIWLIDLCGGGDAACCYHYNSNLLNSPPVWQIDRITSYSIHWYMYLHKFHTQQTLMKQLSDSSSLTLSCWDYALVCLCLRFSFFAWRLFFLELEVKTTGCSRDCTESLFTFFLCFLSVLTCCLWPWWFNDFDEVLVSTFWFEECFLFLFLLCRASAAEGPMPTEKTSVIWLQSYQK